MPKSAPILLYFNLSLNNATAAGVPARIVGKDKAAKPAFEMNQYFIDDDINLNI